MKQAAALITVEQRAANLIAVLDKGITRAAAIIETGNDQNAMAALRAIGTLAVAALERQQQVRQAAEVRNEATDNTVATVRDRLAHLVALNESSSSTTVVPHWDPRDDGGMEIIDAEIVPDEPEVHMPQGMPSSGDIPRSPAPVDTVESAGAVDIPAEPEFVTPVANSPEGATPVASSKGATPVAPLVVPLPGVKRGSGVPPRHQPTPVDSRTMKGFRIRPSML